MQPEGDWLCIPVWSLGVKEPGARRPAGESPWDVLLAPSCPSVSGTPALAAYSCGPTPPLPFSLPPSLAAAQQLSRISILLVGSMRYLRWWLPRVPALGTEPRSDSARRCLFP